MEKSDPWVHRSSMMTCNTCMWFMIKLRVEGESTLGRCRKHAPTMTGYPAVFLIDWCGDHKLDENPPNENINVFIKPEDMVIK